MKYGSNKIGNGIIKYSDNDIELINNKLDDVEKRISNCLSMIKKIESIDSKTYLFSNSTYYFNKILNNYSDLITTYKKQLNIFDDNIINVDHTGVNLIDDIVVPKIKEKGIVKPVSISVEPIVSSTESETVVPNEKTVSIQNAKEASFKDENISSVNLVNINGKVKEEKEQKTEVNTNGNDEKVRVEDSHLEIDNEANAREINDEPTTESDDINFDDIDFSSISNNLSKTSDTLVDTKNTKDNTILTAGLASLGSVSLGAAAAIAAVASKKKSKDDEEEEE